MTSTARALCFMLLLVAASAGAQVCPENQYVHPSRPPGVQTTRAAQLTQVAFSPDRDVTYDLSSGWIRLGIVGGTGYITAHDSYRIIGPGTLPISGLLTVDITYSLYPFSSDCHQPGGVTSSVTVSEGATSRSWSEQANCFGGKSGTQRMHLPLSHVPGEPFTLTYDLQGSTSFSATDVTVRFGFSNLPAGYSVQSCQNLAYAPVATIQRSWGQVKSHYR